MKRLLASLLVALLVSCDAESSKNGNVEPPSSSEASAANAAGSDSATTTSSGTHAGEVADPAGFRYVVLQEGQGTPPPLGAKVAIHWTGWLQDGREIGSTRAGAQPRRQTLSDLELIPGMVRALATMKPGERRKLFLPSDLAYGDVGYPPLVPANADLTIDVELVSFER